DRTSVGLKPMCASVCPSQALFFGTQEEIEALRPRSKAVNSFQFGQQTIRTRVNMMVPREEPVDLVDIAGAMYQEPLAHAASLTEDAASLTEDAASLTGDAASLTDHVASPTRETAAHEGDLLANMFVEESVL